MQLHKGRLVYMTSDQFDHALTELGLSVGEAADLLGQRADRIEDWRHGDAPIPKWVPIYLALLTRNGCLAHARRISKHVTQEAYRNVDQG